MKIASICFCTPCPKCENHLTAEFLRKKHMRVDKLLPTSTSDLYKNIKDQGEILTHLLDEWGLPDCDCLHSRPCYYWNLNSTSGLYDGIMKLLQKSNSKFIAGFQEVRWLVVQNALNNQLFTTIPFKSTQIALLPSIGSIGRVKTLTTHADAILMDSIADRRILFVGDPYTFNAAVFNLEGGIKLGFINSYRSPNYSPFQFKEWISDFSGICNLFVYGGLDNNGMKVEPVHGIIAVGDWNVDNIFFGNHMPQDAHNKCKAITTMGVLLTYGLQPVADTITRRSRNPKERNSCIDFICYSANININPDCKLRSLSVDAARESDHMNQFCSFLLDGTRRLKDVGVTAFDHGDVSLQKRCTSEYTHLIENYESLNELVSQHLKQIKSTL